MITQGFLKYADGKPRVSSTNYRDDIAMGNLEGHQVAESFGRTGSLTSDPQAVDLWPGKDVVAVNQARIANPNYNGMPLEVWSTNASDVGHVAKVVYIAKTTLEQRVGLAMLNGTTHVEVMDSETGLPVNAVYVNQFFLDQPAVDWGVAVGAVICASKTDNTQVFKIIPAGGNVCECCSLMVPGGMVFILSAWFCSTSAAKPVTFYLRASGHFEPVTGEAGMHRHFMYQDMIELNSTPVYKPRSIGKRLPAGTVIKIAAKTASNGGAAQGGFEGWFEPA
jgi:hypothetical protein